jgi:ParB family chromosome partitioning protein
MTAVVAEQSLEELPVASIRESSTNPRRSFDEAALAELTASIAEIGVQVPLLVRPYLQDDGTEYEIVAGARRLRAAIRAGKVTVPCLVREIEDDEVREIQIVENLQRADVHPMEEAEAYARLIAEDANRALIFTANHIAQRVGKTEAYVAQRLKLLDLIPLAQQLFLQQHLTLRHALLLAKIPGGEQVKALYWLLASDPKSGRELPAVIEQAVKSCDSKGWRSGRRVVNATEAELKRWIEQNVLLKLADVPWRLDDEALLPAAGACVDCPKRSGSNAALFGDLTVEDDVCLDPKCFAAKQDATVQYHKDAAKVNGGELLKLSSKPGCDPLPKEITARITFRRGQWVPADPKAAVRCSAIARGLMVDGEDKGRVLDVCVLQECKVHAHQVDKPRAVSSGSSPRGLSWEEQRKLEEQKEQAYLASERPIRKAIYDAVKAKAVLTSDGMLRALIMLSLDDDRNSIALEICDAAGISYARHADRWQSRKLADRRVRDEVPKLSGEALLSLAFDACCADVLEPNDRLHSNVKRDREKCWKWAKLHGVNPDAIAKAVVKAATPKPVKAAAKKAVAKKAATPAKKGAKSKPVKLTAEQRKRIADAMKKRLNAAKKAAKKGAAK